MIKSLPKKRPAIKPTLSTKERDGYTIVLKDIRSEFKIFGESLSGLRESTDGQFNEVRRELNEVKGGLNEIRGELDEVKRGQEIHREVMGQMMEHITEMRYDMKQMPTRAEIAQLEKRILILERRAHV